MKTPIGRASILLVVSGLWLGGQTTINGGRVISGNWDAGNAASTRPVKTGAGLPANCNVGEQFFRTDAAAGQNLYFCTAANAWTQMEAGGGGAPSGPAAGDLSESYPNPAVAKINGTSVPTNSAADQTLVTTASATSSWVALANCVSNGGVLQYATATHTYSCHSLTSADMPASVVQGASSLTTPGAIPKVSPAGTLAESAIVDNGTTALTVTGRVLQVGATLPTLLSAAVNSVWSANSQSVTPQMFGGKADAVTLVSVCSANLTTPLELVCPASTFVAADVGKPITVVGAGTAGAPLTTTIAAYVSGTTVDLATPVITAVSPSTEVTFGTDNATAFAAALAASDHVELPAGRYLYTPPLVLDTNKRLRGVGGIGYLTSTGSVLVVKGGTTADAIDTMHTGTPYGDYGITVEGITIDCGKARSPTGGRGLYFLNAFLSKVADTSALNCHGPGFVFYGGTTLTLSNLNVSYSDDACIGVWAGYNHRISGLTAENCGPGYTGIQFVSGRAYTINGLYVETASYGVGFSNNFLSSTVSGIYTYNIPGYSQSVAISDTHDSTFSDIYADTNVAIYDSATRNTFQNVVSTGATVTWGAGANVILNDGKASAAPGGTVPAWAKYSLVAIANGVNGCANANGCWQVNGVLGANKAAGLTQDVVLFQLPAKGKVTDWRIKTATACTGPATANTGLGTTDSDVLFRAQTYNIKAAVGNTNLTEGPTAGAGSGTAAATNVVASLITTTQNVDQLVAGCAVDYWVQWAVLP